MRRYFAIYFEHISIHHHHLSNCDLSAFVHVVEVLTGIRGYLTYEHDAHSFWVVGEGQLSLRVIDLTVLVELVEFEVVSFNFLDCIDVGIDHVSTVFD